MDGEEIGIRGFGVMGTGSRRKRWLGSGFENWQKNELWFRRTRLATWFKTSFVFFFFFFQKKEGGGSVSRSGLVFETEI